MSLLTIEEIRARIETALSDEALLDIRDACEQALDKWAGPLVLSDSGTVEPNTETLWPNGRVLRLLGTPESVVSITETRDGVDALIDAVNYRVVGREIVRAAIGWSSRVEVVYVPVDDSATRKMALIQMIQLEINFEPGTASEGAGPWSQTYANYRQQRRELLMIVRPPDPRLMRAVPVAPADPVVHW